MPIEIRRMTIDVQLDAGHAAPTGTEVERAPVDQEQIIRKCTRAVLDVLREAQER